MKGSHLITTKGYLESIRFLGLTTADAVNELIDNSLDADAKNVHIHIFHDRKNVSIVVEDDGVGVLPEKIANILSFGGRALYGEESRTGRFGWGLPSAACCQTIRTEFYSKTNGAWNYSYIDLGELKLMDEPIIPGAIEQDPPQNIKLSLQDAATSTIVYMKDCDRLDYKKIDTLEDYLIENVGEVHRKYLTKGRKIFINGKMVPTVDPLMLTSGCNLCDKLGYGKDYADIAPIIVDPKIIDACTGQPAEVKIRLSLLDYVKITPLYNVNARKKLGISTANQGFYIIRHDRQIARAQTLGIFTRHNSLNYFRGEISFSPELDEYFGIQTNKSRFSLNNELKEQIDSLVGKYISEITDAYTEFGKKKKAVNDEHGIRQSEKIAAKVEKRLKASKHSPSPEEVRQAHQEEVKEKKELIAKIQSDERLTEKQKAEKVCAVENRFQFTRPFRLVLEYIESGNFYFPRPKGKNTEVVINTAHPFYSKIYERATQNGLDTYLDLLLFTLAKGELEFFDKEEVRKFYKAQRSEWSAILNAYLSEDEGDEEPDE